MLPPPSAEPTFSRPVRILILTAALALTGGMVGAVLGAIVSILALGPVEAALMPGFIGFGAYFGAIIGAILAPLTGWLLLRRVPLGLAVGGTTVGTLAGAVMGLIVGGGNGSVMFAIVGFVGSAVLLRLTASRARERTVTFSPNP
ncbi:hypothetical protein [Longimicrobium sp.]|jgi:cation transporter-like permease|uniref:hypothetical protein n=1 Tax=Longimicrobium sp. TaxID=2029185 RepID=UPI002F958CC2